MKKLLFCILTLMVSLAAFSTDYSALKFRFTENVDAFQGNVPEGYEKLTLYNDLEKIELLAEKEIVLDGSYIEKISIREDDFVPQYYQLNITFNEEGAYLFGYITNANIGRHLLAQVDSKMLFNARIMMAIYGGEVAVSGLLDLEIVEFFIENFQTECNINPSVADVEYSDINSFDEKSTVNIKNQAKVAEAFIYYYIRNNPEWEKYVYEGDESYHSNLISILQDKRNGYENLEDYKVSVQIVSKSFKRPPIFLFRGKSALPVVILVKFEKEDNKCIKRLNLLVDKKGRYYVTGF